MGAIFNMYAIFRHGKQYRVGNVTNIDHVADVDGKIDPYNPFTTRITINKKWHRWENEVILLTKFYYGAPVTKHTRRIQFQDIPHFIVDDAVSELDIIKKRDEIVHKILIGEDIE